MTDDRYEARQQRKRAVVRFQMRLKELGYLPADAEVDGIFGPVTYDAYNHYRASIGLPPETLVLTVESIEAVLFPPPPKPVSTNPLAILWALIPVFTKGTAMNNNDIQGILRAVLASLAGYLAGRGIIPVVPPEVVASVAAALVSVWSVWSKRAPKA